MSNMKKVYDQFFDSLEIIINGDSRGGTWQQRATRLAEEANLRSSQISLQELINWVDVIEPTLECEETEDDEDDEDLDDDDDFDNEDADEEFWTNDEDEDDDNDDEDENDDWDEDEE